MNLSNASTDVPGTVLNIHGVGSAVLLLELALELALAVGVGVGVPLGDPLARF